MFRIFEIITIFILLQLVVTRHAYAYLDPGTGSYIFQLLIASFLGVLLSVKVFWKSIRSFITRFMLKFRNLR